jgi:hypothetical protein
MVRPGITVQEAIDVTTMDSGGVAATVLALAARARVQVASTGPSSYALRRRVRPLWAFVCGCVTAPTVLGLLFFLVRTSETGTVVVATPSARSRPGTRSTVHLSGRLPADLVAGIRTALAGHSVPATGPVMSRFAAGVVPGPGRGPAEPSTGPIDVTGPIDRTAPDARTATGGPTARADRSAGHQPGRHTFATPQTAAEVGMITGLNGAVTAPSSGRASDADAASTGEPVVVIVLDSGASHVLGALILIGRDPAASDGDGDPGLLPVEDPDFSVSKTHLAVGRDGSGVWVMDRGSVNGTVVVTQAGESSRCPAGVRVPISPNSTVHFGARRFTIRMSER